MSDCFKNKNPNKKTYKNTPPQTHTPIHWQQFTIPMFISEKISASKQQNKVL